MDKWKRKLKRKLKEEAPELKRPSKSFQEQRIVAGGDSLAADSTGCNSHKKMPQLSWMRNGAVKADGMTQRYITSASTAGFIILLTRLTKTAACLQPRPHIQYTY